MSYLPIDFSCYIIPTNNQKKKCFKRRFFMCNIFQGSENYSQISTQKLIGLFQENISTLLDASNHHGMIAKNQPQNKDHLIATEATLQDVERLLNLNANPNATFRDGKGNKIPLISFAAKTANPKLTRLLLSYGANPNARDHNGNSCLGLTLTSHVISFVSNDCNNDGFGEYVFESAKRNLFKREKTISLFIEAGAKTKIFNRTKETPIHNLMIGDIKGVIHKDKYLQDRRRFDGNQKSVLPVPQMVEIPLRVFDRKEVLVPNNEEKEKIILKLLEQGINLNSREYNGYTPLHLAVIKQDIHLARTFIENGGDVNSRSNKGITPLHIAAYKCNKELVDLLLDHGAKTTLKDQNSRTASDYALLKDNLELAKYIKERGTDLLEKAATSQQPASTPFLFFKGPTSQERECSISNSI
jgi:ankyrin repeat protein